MISAPADPDSAIVPANTENIISVASTIARILSVRVIFVILFMCTYSEFSLARNKPAEVGVHLSFYDMYKCFVKQRESLLF
jgi:hypothetical protein